MAPFELLMELLNGVSERGTDGMRQNGHDGAKYENNAPRTRFHPDSFRRD